MLIEWIVSRLSLVIRFEQVSNKTALLQLQEAEFIIISCQVDLNSFSRLNDS